MEIGTVLVLIGLILAIVSMFVIDHFARLLSSAVILVAVGILVGAPALTI